MNKKESAFIKAVLDFHALHGRHTLPWRTTTDPYRIHVSEVMLQQTQVDRVLPKYESFIKKFPTVKALARASLHDVLKLWQGLGYNRRAKLLHLCAQEVVSSHKGAYPSTQEELVQLPGIGPYTAGAILAFAYNKDVTLIETNVRSVFLHHFFPNATQVNDAELLEVIEKTAPRGNARMWYWALMDYGSHLKKELDNPNKRSLHYVRQSAFKGSDRQIRGAIVKLLIARPYTRVELHKKLASFEDARVDAQLQKLQDEGMVICMRKKYMLPK